MIPLDKGIKDLLEEYLPCLHFCARCEQTSALPSLSRFGTWASNLLCVQINVGLPS